MANSRIPLSGPPVPSQRRRARGPGSRLPVLGRVVCAVVAALATGVALLPGAAAGGPRPDGTVSVAATGGPSTVGSIAFIRNHNIWIARADGTGATAVTRDGTAAKPYRFPSMSDTGIIATVRDEAIVLLKQNGTVLRRIPVPRGHLYINNGAGSFSVTGAVDAEISPGGTRIAYHQVRLPSLGSSMDVRTGFTDVTGLSDLGKYGVVLGDTFTWTTETTGVLLDGNPRFYDLTTQTDRDWFNQRDVTGSYGDSALALRVSRDGRLVAWASYLSGGIVLARINGAPGAVAPTPPTSLCALHDTVPLEHPQFSPDSTTLLWQSGSEVWTGWNFETGTACAGMDAQHQRRILTNASQPHWSAAPLDTRPEPRATKKRQHAKKVLRNVRRPVIKGKPRVGRPLRATKGRWKGKPKKFAFRWFRNAKPVRGKRGAKRRYVVRRADRGRRISVRVAVRKPGLRGKNVARSRPVKVRRR